MLLANMDVGRGLCNGSRGVVVDFKDGMKPVVKFVNGDRVQFDAPSTFRNVVIVPREGPRQVSRTQYPLALAWATTIHKSQGATLDRVRTNILDCFEVGQAYVAISRVRSPDGLQITAYSPLSFKASKLVREFYGDRHH